MGVIDSHKSSKVLQMSRVLNPLPLHEIHDKDLLEIHQTCFVTFCCRHLRLSGVKIMAARPAAGIEVNLPP